MPRHDNPGGAHPIGPGDLKFFHSHKNMKKHRMMFECIAEEETEDGAIPLSTFTGILTDISKAVKKHKFTAYDKGYPKEVLDYVPTNKTYRIETVLDIAKLSAEQFEMLIDDLREYCNAMRFFEGIKHLP